MKLTLNIPDNMQLDLVRMGATLELPLEKVVVAMMAVGVAATQDNDLLKRRIKEEWFKEGK